MTTFYKCENCDHVSDDINEIDIVDWANAQDPADTCGIPSGSCEKCGAPVYEEGTFKKQDAARAMLAALQWLTDWAREHTSPRDANTPHEILKHAVAAIAAAKAAGITPATLTK